jgi:methylmalonyl-CoA/ethylmalonyl-CoA epimerase
MIEKIDHIGVAVESIEEALKIYIEVFHLEVKEIEEVKDQKVRTATVPIGGSNIELLESTDPEGPIAKYIEKRGEGVHHIAFRVGNVEDALEEMKRKGMRLIDEKPRMGTGGARIAFLHPRSTRGVLLELCER